MTSPLLALFTRSLREDVRGRATYWTRGALGGFLLLVLLSFAASSRWNNAPGRTFFTSIIVFQMVALSFIGLSYFTAAVAEEKEEQTLGLLRMTGLSPLSILLGKSTSRLCGALLLLIAQFPFTIFAITLGGVSLRQIAAVYCTIGAFTFLLCNLALLGSVLARRTGGAVVFSVAVIVVLLGLGPLLGVLPATWQNHLGGAAAIDRVADALWQATPIARLREVLETGFNGAATGVQVASNLALGVGCFLLAWAAFERSSDRAPAEAAAGSTAKRRFLGLRLSRPPRPWKDALMWKDFYFLCGGYAGMAIRTLLYGGALVPLVYHANGTTPAPSIMNQLMFSMVPFAFSIDVAAMASRIFGVELRDQTFADLATLPFTIRQLSYRKALACVLAAAPAVLGTAVVQVFAVIGMTARGVNSGMAGLGPMMAVQACSLWVHTLLLIHVVAWLSLHMKRGALPVGYVLTYAISSIISILFMALAAAGIFTRMAFTNNSSGSWSNIAYLLWSVIPTSVGSVVAAWILHRLTLQRLEILAGES